MATDCPELDLLNPAEVHIRLHYRTLEADRPLPEHDGQQEPNLLDDLISLVHQQETSGQLINPDPDSRNLSLDPRFSVEPISIEESIFRHSGWRITRSQVYAAMCRAYNEGHIGRHRLHNFANCGSGSYVQLSTDRSQVRLVGNYCHDRLCQVCQTAKARIATQVIADHCKGKLVRFLTLTIRHSQTPLKAQIRRLLAAAHELRRTKGWRDHVAGGCYLFEVKWIPATKTWHPHLHFLAETDWISQKWLSEEWHKITGDSYIVDVRPIQDQHALANYVTKYCGKAVDHAVYASPAALSEYIAAIRSVRVLSTFGSWRGLKLRPKVESKVKWINVGRLDNLIARARAGEAYARRWLEAAMRIPPTCGDDHAPTRPPPDRTP
jgi:hypothetical protein